jgi:uncharacterized caspase-like protein
MERRVAFLIGNQTYREDSGLTPLSGPLNDVEALDAVLGDPARGGFEVRCFRDAYSGEIKAAIEEELGTASRGDLVLIAYAGHGKLDRNGKLCLATADTRSAALHATSIPAQQLCEMVENSDCDAVVLLLDCCYSGAAADLRGDVESQLGSLQNASGFYILTASSEVQTAGEAEVAINGGLVMGRFTSALVEGIRTGAADQDRDGEIKLRDLVRHIQETVKHQTPRFLAARATGDPLISRSPNTDDRLPADVLEGLIADSSLVRIGAAWRLARLARNDTSRTRHVERKIIERLEEAGERDHLVREALKDALRSARELPDFKDTQALPDFRPSVDPFNITGVWECNDGGVYYIRNLGREVWWFGHGVHPHQSFANVAYGQVEGEGDTRILRLKWADVPAGTTNIYGRLVLRLDFSIQLNRVTHISTAERSGNFGGSHWTYLAAWGERLRQKRQAKPKPENDAGEK